MNLPTLHTADLDAGTLAALFDDIESTLVLDVLVKGPPTQHASDRPVPLREAERLLAAGAVRGVQLRYRWEGEEWRDTLIARPGGARLVRMKMDPLVSNDS